MKTERLLGILVTLLSKEKVTAPQLAEKFVVSRRTISRDIEHLCRAGIPIVTTQGKYGGISVMEGYKVDHTLLTSADMQAILAGLQSLDSVSANRRYQQLMEKISAGNPSILDTNRQIQIDLSSWYKESLAPRIGLIQEAVKESVRIRFHYISPRGESVRLVEPYQLFFKWSSWYLWGYCMEKQDFRLFKLNRMTELVKTQEKFEPREAPAPDMSDEKIFPARFQAEVRFAAQAKWRLIEEFGADSFQEQEDGTLLFTFPFSDRENLFEWLLSFGDRAELLKPKELREALRGKIKEMYEKYK